MREHFGFSAFVSIGSMLDVGWGDLIDYLGNDPYTKSILLYMESIGDVRAFMSAAREVALSKPIIVLKGGRSAAAAQAAASHTGSLIGSDEVLHAALRRCGAVRVNSIADLFNMAEVLAKLAAVAWMALGGAGAQPLFWAVLVLSAISSHAPRELRHWPVLPRRAPER